MTNKKIIISMDEALDEKLKEQAKAEYRSKASLIRQLVARGLDNGSK